MGTSPNMGLSVLIPGTTTGPGWATSLEADKLLIDSHTHVSGQGLQVPSAGININAALPFGNNPGTGISYVGLQSQTTQSGVLASAIQQQSGDLYWYNASKIPVQITSGNTINVSAFGGITNLAGTTGALTYSAALQLFIATSATNLSAGWDGADITVRPRNVASAAGVKIQAPTTLGSSYTTTLPPALPAATTSGIILIGPSPSGVQTIANALPATNLFAANQFSAYRAAAFTIGGSSANVAFIPDTKLSDAGGGLNTTNGIFTIPASGVWSFAWAVGCNGMAAGNTLVSYLIVNSGQYAPGSYAPVGGGNSTVTGGSAIYANALAGDTVKVNVQASAATGATMTAGSGFNYFHGFQIR